METVVLDDQNAIHPEDRGLVENLAKLQDMHLQINDLRGLLPERLLRPTRVALESPRSVSPEKLAANLRKAASDGSRDIQRFKKDFHSPEMKDLFQKTGSAEFAQGRDSWAVDYVALVRDSKPVDNVTNVKVDVNSTVDAASSSTDEEAILQKYDGSQSGIFVTRTSTSDIYPLTVSVDSLRFTITSEESDGKKTLDLALPADPKSSILGTQILKIIKERGVPANLETLLSMLASYHDFKFKACERCQNLFDDAITYPLVRQRKPATNQDTRDIEWEVVHSSCVT